MNDQLAQQLAALSPEQRQRLRERLDERQSSAQTHIPARPAGMESVPLSFAQQRLWVLDQLDPGNPAYNIPIAVRLSGALDTGALARALETLVQRHSILRVRFRLIDGEPVQQIVPSAALSLPLDEVPGADQAAVEAWVARLYSQGFRLAEEPPLRAHLLRIAPETHVLALVVHHIAADGWSLGVLIHELMVAYHDYARGAALAALPELPLEYADFALWQRRGVDSPAIAAALNYWRQRLAEPTALELPTDRLRPTVQRYRGATARHTLPVALAERLQRLGQAERCTLFMLGLAAFDALLYRSSGQTDLLVGAPVAGRTRPELEPLVGVFVNTLVLRANVVGGAPFRTLLHQVREVCLEAFEHQELPFERLVDAVQPARDPSRNPIFQVMFEVQNAPAPQLVMEGLELTPVEFDWGISKFDLNMVLLETSGGLRVDIQYNTDLFDAATIKRMLARYQILLEGIAADPDTLVDDLLLMSQAERRLVLEEFNHTVPARPLDRPAHRVIEAQVRQCPQAVAAVCGTQELSYDDLNRRANKMARWLRRLPVESRVGVFGERGLDMLVVLLATMKAGVVYMPLDPANPDARLRSILEDSGCALIMTETALVERTLALAEQTAQRPQVFCWEAAPDARIAGDVRACAELPDDNLDLEVPPRALANIFYTSGSTAQPKGAQIEHIGMLNHLWGKIDVFAMDAHSRLAQSASHCFDISIWQFIAPLMVGGATVIYDQEHVLDQALFVQALRRDRTTILETVPSLLQAMLETVERLDAAGRAPELPDVRIATALGRDDGVSRGCGRRIRWLRTRIAPFLDAELTVRVARRLAGGVEAALRHVLFRIVLLDPGQDVFGVARDDGAERGGAVRRQRRANQGNRAVEQELAGGVVQSAQHATQLAAAGHGTGHVQAVCGRRVGDQAKAEQPDQGGMLHEKGAQGTHRRLLLMELDEVGGDERGTGGGRGARPGPVGGPFGEVRPVKRAEQDPILLGDRTGGDEGGQGCVGIGQRLRSWAVERADGRFDGRWGAPEDKAIHGGAQVREGTRQVRYHSGVSDSGGWLGGYHHPTAIGDEQITV